MQAHRAIFHELEEISKYGINEIDSFSVLLETA
jgi:hypothetical protein